MILVDTGPIVAAATVNDEHFHRSSELLTGLRLAGRRLLLPSTVAAEAAHGSEGDRGMNSDRFIRCPAFPSSVSEFESKGFMKDPLEMSPVGTKELKSR